MKKKRSTVNNINMKTKTQKNNISKLNVLRKPTLKNIILNFFIIKHMTKYNGKI